MTDEAHLFTEYRQYMRRRGYAETTRRQRISTAREWCSATPDWRRATHRDIEQWLDERYSSAEMSRCRMVRLRAWYRWAIRSGYTDTDPTLRVDAPRVAMRLPRPAPDLELGRLFRDTTDTRMRCLYALMALAGLRCVECSRLDWRDVDLPAGVIRVDGKGRRERVIAVSPDVVAALRAHAVGSGRRAGAVFVGQSGQRLEPYRVSQLVNVTLHRDGYRFSAHQLRHRYATAALQVPGADLLAVRDLLGHTSVATTQIYTKCIPGLAAQVSRALVIPGVGDPGRLKPAPGRAASSG